MGIRKQITFLEEEAVLQVRSDRMDHRPYGLDGGQSGAPTRNQLLHDGVAQHMPSKFTEWIHHGDSFDHCQAGGGGFGDPFARDPALVLTDVRNGLVSPASARRDYGVAIDIEHWMVDGTGTERLRRR